MNLVRGELNESVLLHWSSRLDNSLVRPAFHSLDTASAPQDHLVGSKYVHSPFDFAVLTLSHIERVALLGLEICRQFPEFAKGLEPEMVRVGLREFHDREKLDYSSNFLQLVGWMNRRHPFYHLVERYGTNSVDPDEIVDLNRAGSWLRNAFLSEHGLLDGADLYTTAGLAYLRIEHIADLVDTGLAPERREEMGRDLRRGSEMLVNSVESQIARHLEDHYEELTQDLRFHSLRQPLWDLISRRELKWQLCPSTEIILNSKHSLIKFK